MQSCDAEAYNLETYNLDDVFQFQPFILFRLSTLIHPSSQ